MTTTEPRGNAVGPAGEQAARNIGLLRDARGLSLRVLSDLLADLGRPVRPSALHAVSQLTRRIDVDDLIALAVALRVNPSAILFPRDGDSDDVVELTPLVKQRAAVVWGWADGRYPLPSELAEPGSTAVGTPAGEFADFQRYARPVYGPPADPVTAELGRLIALLETVLARPGDHLNWVNQRDAVMRRFRLAEIQFEEFVAARDRDAGLPAGDAG
jgi:hypothetical protein